MTTDFSPMPIDAETFLDKLACGFGRVVIFLQENDARPFREVILDSCLHHRAFDRQTESYRADYLLDIIDATREPEFYAARIRQALATDDEDYSYGQLYELAARFAEKGDEEARRVMYDRFTRQAVQQDTTGADDLITLDGLNGYLFVAEQWQRHPLPEEDHWEEAWLLKTVEKQIGQEETRQALGRAAQEQPALAAYLAEVEEKRTRWHNWRREHKPAPVPSYDDLRTWIADAKQTTRWQKWRSWSRRLDEETLARLAHDLLTETDRGPLLKLLHLFRERPFPLPIDRLLTLARGRDEDLAEAAQWALGNLTDQRIRDLALELGTAETPPVATLRLLHNNFALSDYQRIERIVREDMDADEFHHLGIIVRDLIKDHLSPEAQPTLQELYDRGRCTLCRNHVVELLASLGPLPAWIRQECRYDADTQTRSLAAEAPAQL